MTTRRDAPDGSARPRTAWLAVLVACVAVLACPGENAKVPDAARGGGPSTPAAPLAVVASFPDRQITGVAVSRDSRLFVNVPYWPGQEGTEVLEVLPDGTRALYPSADRFGWTAESGLDPADRFVCVQSVWADDRDRLWILDPASPNLAGVVPGGPKLVAVDLSTDEVLEVHRLDDAVAGRTSYLNDVRVDTTTGTAYITDSGAGGLVVVDLAAGTSRRVLADHPSTRAEPGVVPEIEGVSLRGVDGEPLLIHADGLALGPGGEWLYYHALTGRHLYRVPTRALRDAALAPDELAALVEDLGATVVTDGMLADAAGNIYHTALERSAIVRRTIDGRLETVVEDPRLRWPDSLALGTRGELYVTTSQIHRSALLGNAEMRREPYRVFRIDPGTGAP